jgi:hypothetical protein
MQAGGRKSISATHIARPRSAGTPYRRSIMSHLTEWVPNRSIRSSKLMSHPLALQTLIPNHYQDQEHPSK